MLEVRNLSKEYKSKRRKKVLALDDLNFTLPNNGMVFIIGKSGSGKSTLLNVLGGLDESTTGEIIVNGNCFSTFSHRDYANYRNTCVGFIFQDFHLLDDLTVEENVALSLDLQNCTDKEKVLEALKRVDLEGYEKRYPLELSGGQKQRVAIARALVKDPTVLLADEPTGNLDAKTTGQVLDLLKEISKEKLVLIVSHNLNDADKYADRILELSDGKIIKDVSRREGYNEEIEVVDGVLRIPYLKKLTMEDEAKIADELAVAKICKIKQKDDKFAPTPKEAYKDELLPIRQSKMRFEKLWQLTGKFVKSSLFRSVFSGFMAACIVMILALSQIIVAFNPGDVIKSELLSSQQSVLALQKNDFYQQEGNVFNINTKSLVEIGENDIQTFRDNGYEGGMYELTNYSMGINYYGTAYQSLQSRTQIRTNFYVKELLGTLITTEEFLLNKFGVNGELPLLCGTLDAHPGGVIITDYFADSIFKIRGGAAGGYERLLGPFRSTDNNKNGYINAIIKTDYKERYKSLLEMYGKKEKLDYSELSKNQIFLDAYDEIIQYLGIGYSINPNFKEDCKSSEVKNFIYPGDVYINGIEVTMASKVWMLMPKVSKITGDEIILSYALYNHIFQTEYTSQTLKNFQPHTVTLQTYRLADEGRTKPVHSITVTVKELGSSGSALIHCSEELFYKFRETEFVTYGLYFDNIEDIAGVYQTGEMLGYVPNSMMVQSASTMTRAVSVFSDFFFLISLVLYVGCASVLISFGVKSVKEKKYEIGVIKALGGKGRNLSLIFSVEIALVGLLTCVFSWIGLYLFIGVANDVLVASLAELATSHVVRDMNFLVFNPTIMALDSLGVMGLTLVSTAIPMLALKNIKPINIIKAKE